MTTHKQHEQRCRHVTKKRPHVLRFEPKRDERLARGLHPSDRMFDAGSPNVALATLQDVSDRQFDRLFPRRQRFRSAWHWTPIDVARRACSLLAPDANANVLDIGSGVGKLCLVGAVTTKASWVGVELDAEMVRAAECAARKLRLMGSLRFVCGDAHELDWSKFDALYMFNPFVEDLLDSPPTLRLARLNQNVERTRQQLRRLRPGARLVTLHGFGGDVPDGFDLVHREAAHDDFLCLWVRRVEASTAA